MRSIPILCIFSLCALCNGVFNRQQQQSPPLNGGPAANSKCEQITIPLCLDIQYNTTIFPNLLNHQKQEDASVEVHQFSPLVKVKCSPDLKFFLCTMYAPVCTVLDEPIPPCQELCLSAKSGCESLMNKFGFSWPEAFKCENFPPSGLCVGENKTRSSASSSNDNNFKGQNLKNQPPPQLNSLNINIVKNAEVKKFSPPQNKETHSPLGGDLSIFECELTTFSTKFTQENSDYKITFGRHVLNSCALPCSGIFFQAEQRSTLQNLNFVFATLCFLSTLFTLVTFLVDRPRFNYPEKPIIFLSLCYCVISSVFMTGYFSRERIACVQPAQLTAAANAGQNVDAFLMTNNGQDAALQSEILKTFERIKSLVGDSQNQQLFVGQGIQHSVCVFTAVIYYYFFMSACVWWVNLTLTWFLASGLKWGNEAIETSSKYFHVAAWGLPSVLTVFVLVARQVDGDVYSGLCFVGNWDSQALIYFVLTPMCVCLFLGFLFLILGVVSMLKIRQFMKHDGTKIEKLERLMIRISVFSLMFLVPTCVLVACYVYQALSIDYWLAFWWYTQKCGGTSASEMPLQIRRQCSELAEFSKSRLRPEFFVFIIKYLAILSIGFTNLIWIWSPKTLQSWRRTFNSWFCQSNVLAVQEPQGAPLLMTHQAVTKLQQNACQPSTSAIGGGAAAPMLQQQNVAAASSLDQFGGNVFRQQTGNAGVFYSSDR
uniref:Uncharacterized protein n=1 Tax=Romanomermis culicivorax TaxID=13658 RepID=A0A915I0C3_ROMCU